MIKDDRRYNLKQREEKNLPPEVLFSTLSRLFGKTVALEKMKEFGFNYQVDLSEEAQGLDIEVDDNANRND